MDLKLKPTVDWEVMSDQQVVLLVPRFSNPFFIKLFTPNRPHFRVKLDEIGSFLFTQCDGNHTVFEICDQLKEKFGERVEPIYERSSVFFQKLIKEKLMVFDIPSDGE